MRVPRLPKVSFASLESAAKSRSTGFVVRSSAVLFLGATLLHGLSLGGHLDYEGSPFAKLPGQISSWVGMAADDIRITGLTHHEPETLLAALNIKPGGSLIGFDAGYSRDRLQNLDWIESAKVQRLFPNQLEIAVVERIPFAIWQKAGKYYVIDKSGAALSSLDPGSVPHLPLVTGEGAESTAEELVNQLSATPELSSQLAAAARVGQRRWNLYLNTGVIVMLPEQEVEAALGQLHDLQKQQGLLTKAIKTVDLRFRDRVIIGLADGASDTEFATGSLPAKKSR